MERQASVSREAAGAILLAAPEGELPLAPTIIPTTFQARQALRGTEVVACRLVVNGRA